MTDFEKLVYFGLMIAVAVCLIGAAVESLVCHFKNRKY
jgi:hypothetical protein